VHRKDLKGYLIRALEFLQVHEQHFVEQSRP
jgi:hypothetical protein